MLLLFIILSVHAGAAGVADAFDAMNIDARGADAALYEAGGMIIPDISSRDVVGALISGTELPGADEVFQKLYDLAFGELRAALKGAAAMLAVIILCSIVTAAGSSFASGEVSRTADAVCVVSGALTMTLVLKDMISVCIDTVSGGVSFIKALTPTMVLLMFTGGDAVGAGTLEFRLFFIIEAMAQAVEYFFIPLVCCRLALCAADAVFDGIKLSGLAGLIKSALNFSLGLMLTVFTGFITINRIAASVGDAAGKTVRFTVSNAVPVVGKIISDSADLVITYSHVIKSAFGVFGMTGVILIFLSPLIRIGARLLIFRLAAALSETLGSPRLCALFGGFAEAVTYIFSISVCVCVFLIITLGLTTWAGAK